MIPPSATPATPATPAKAAMSPSASTLSVRVPAPEEFATFDQQLAAQHDLGAGRSVGDYLRQIVERDGQPVALLVYLFQIKGPQPKLLKQAQQCDALKGTPFLTTAKAATAG